VQHFYRKEPSYIWHLKTFGEVGVVLKHQQKLRGKLADPNQHCLFFGYGTNHAVDCFCMLNLETHKIIHTQDVTWLDKIYGKFKYINRTNLITLDNSNDERTYIASVMDKLETLCGVEQFPKANCLMSDLYHPELDESPLLGDLILTFQCLVWVHTIPASCCWGPWLCWIGQ
jgi:hypothetical protein